MVGGTVGEVVASRNPNFAVGDIAMGYGGWQDYAVANGSGLRKLNPAAAPVSTALGVLGMPGMTAYRRTPRSEPERADCRHLQAGAQSPVAPHSRSTTTHAAATPTTNRTPPHAQILWSGFGENVFFLRGCMWDLSACWRGRGINFAGAYAL
jgi:hypothetical protein